MNVISYRGLSTKFKNTADGKACITIVAAMAVSCSLSPDWQGWLMLRKIGAALRWSHAIIEDHPILNGIIVLSAYLFTYLVYRRWKHDIDNRWYRLLIVLCGLQQLWISNPLKTVKVIGWFDYRWLGTFCLLALLIALSGKWKKLVIDKWDKARNGRKKKDNAARFSLDTIDYEGISESKQKYADAIVTHLLGTKLGKQSFAIGITGAWGTGKSTFLDVIASKMVGKAEVVRFNPWMCRTPEQVTEDFFVTLYREMSSKHSTLSRPIRDYAKYISTATFTIGDGFLSKLTLLLPQESLSSRKRRLSERFEKLEKPVVVFIDDLDRLECDEIFEVLRLIRNTADLSNVFYVVAYDKTYVIDALKEKINSAEAYLDKIFPIETHLPKIEESQIYKMLYGELSKQHEYGERFAKALSKHIDQSGRELVINILKSYRSVMRFSRVFLLNMDYIIRAYPKEVRMIDMFWMELLQMYDKKTYDVLANDRDLLLLTAGKQYSLKKGIKEGTIQKGEELDTYKGERFWKQLTPQILSLLFEDRKTLNKFSMRYAENYDKYFTLSVSEYRLSFNEFEKLFDNQEDPLKTVEGWVNQQKYFSSIIYHFESKEITCLASDALGRYIMGMLELVYQTFRWSDSVIYHVKSQLRKDAYLPNQTGWGKGYMLGWFNERIALGGDLKIIGKMLRRLYVSNEVDENGCESEPDRLLISNEDIKMLLRDIMRKYLELHPDMSALSILDSRKESGEVFGNCCVCITDNCQIFEDTDYENVAFEMVMKHFERKEKPSYREFERALNKMFQFDVPDYIGPADYEAYMDGAVEDRDRRLASYFGSNWDKVNEFKSRCFVER